MLDIYKENNTNIFWTNNNEYIKGYNIWIGHYLNSIVLNFLSDMDLFLSQQIQLCNIMIDKIFKCWLSSKLRMELKLIQVKWQQKICDLLGDYKLNLITDNKINFLFGLTKFIFIYKWILFLYLNFVVFIILFSKVNTKSLSFWISCIYSVSKHRLTKKDFG